MSNIASTSSQYISRELIHEDTTLVVNFHIKRLTTVGRKTTATWEPTLCTEDEFEIINAVYDDDIQSKRKIGNLYHIEWKDCGVKKRDINIDEDEKKGEPEITPEELKEWQIKADEYIEKDIKAMIRKRFREKGYDVKRANEFIANNSAMIRLNVSDARADFELNNDYKDISNAKIRKALLNVRQINEWVDGLSYDETVESIKKCAFNVIDEMLEERECDKEWYYHELDISRRITEEANTIMKTAGKDWAKLSVEEYWVKDRIEEFRGELEQCINENE
jgi:hypothetical protein